MSTTAVAPSTPQSRPRLRIQGRQNFLTLVRSEWIKIRSVASTWVTAALSVSSTVLLGAALAIAYASTPETAGQAKHMVAAGSAFGHLVVSVLGALAITGEYSSGQIRSSLAAAPQRTRLMTAKALVVSALAFLLGASSVLLSWAVSAPFMGEHAGSLTDSHYLGYVWGVGLSFVVITLMSLALGYLLRSTAGTITVCTVLLFVLQIPLVLASTKWRSVLWVVNLLPANAVQALADPYSLAHTWGAEGSFSLSQPLMVAVAAAWALVPLLAAWLTFTKRDA
ncbi:ABC transporter permease subunit [Actinomyces trachealis]|uniref:ABC transporter permease subunit n=1 Tax=Actinomyces trachealis TaxID=2763540 RepID=UPI001892D212|nr:ABC transporter permease subunit [Actinomyces trachealis]